MSSLTCVVVTWVLELEVARCNVANIFAFFSERSKSRRSECRDMPMRVRPGLRPYGYSSQRSFQLHRCSSKLAPSGAVLPLRAPISANVDATDMARCEDSLPSVALGGCPGV